MGMAQQQPEQLLAGVTAGADNGDTFLFHIGRLWGLEIFHAKQKAPLTRASRATKVAASLGYRLLYWNRLRAPGWPYFLRSRIRGSRVKSPSALRTGRKLASTVSRARAIP